MRVLNEAQQIYTGEGLNVIQLRLDELALDVGIATMRACPSQTQVTIYLNAKGPQGDMNKSVGGKLRNASWQKMKDEKYCKRDRKKGFNQEIGGEAECGVVEGNGSHCR